MRKKRTGTLATGMASAILLLYSCSHGKTLAFADSLRGVDGEKAVTLSRNRIDSIARHDPENLVSEIRAIVAMLETKGDRKAAMTVAAYPYGIDADERPDIAARLLTSTLLPGRQAPAIGGLAQSGKKHTATILLFHESACRTCGDVIWELKQRYAELQKAGVRVVTVSTDTDEKTWTEYAATLPWPDKLCDYKGFYNPSMIAYGGPATPTLFLIDGKGIVTGQYGSPEEIMDLLLKQR